MERPLFKNIGGYFYQKKEAERIANFFKNYDYFCKKGAKLPRGIIFYGEPGTGKTMFAQAIANEANIEIFPLTTDQFYKESNISSAIKKVFEEASNHAPSMILIDELDRLVNCEMTYQKNESDKQREALRVLLTEIDKIQNKGVLIVATANIRLRFIPAALVRNGRIEKHIEVGIPTKEDRIEILNIYLANNPCFKNIVSEDIAAYTSNFSGAALATLVNDVLINCIAKDKEATFDDFIEPIEIIKNSGIRKKSSDDNSSTIYHEIGHFIADYELNKTIGMINVVPFAQSNGTFSRVDVEEQNKTSNMSYTKMYNECIISISGLVATELFKGEAYMGAGNDIEKLTNRYIEMAKSGLLDNYSMGLSLLATMDFYTTYNDSHNEFVNRFSKFVDEIKQKSKEILLKHKDLVNILFEELNKKSVLTHTEIEEIIEKHNCLN